MTHLSLSNSRYTFYLVQSIKALFYYLHSTTKMVYLSYDARSNPQQRCATIFELKYPPHIAKSRCSLIHCRYNYFWDTIIIASKFGHQIIFIYIMKETWCATPRFTLDLNQITLLNLGLLLLVI